MAIWVGKDLFPETTAEKKCGEKEQARYLMVEDQRSRFADAYHLHPLENVMKAALLVFSILSGLASTAFAAHAWTGPFSIKELSYDQDDFPKKRIVVKVMENANFYRFVTNDALYPQADADGLKAAFSLLTAAEAQQKKVYLFCENLDANGNWRFVGVKIVNE